MVKLLLAPLVAVALLTGDNATNASAPDAETLLLRWQRAPCEGRALLAVAPDVVVATATRALAATPDAQPRACIAVVRGLAFERLEQRAAMVEDFHTAAALWPQLAPHVQARQEAKATRTETKIDTTPPNSVDVAINRIDQLIKRAQPQAALRLALAMPRGPVQNDALEAATINAYVKNGDAAGAVVHAEKLKDSDVILKAYAFALGKAARETAAAEKYAALAKRTTDVALQNEATFLSAFALYEAGALDAAANAFAQALPTLSGTTSEANARWYLAWCHVLLGHDALARDALQALITALPLDKETRKHRYWLAEMHASQNEQPQATALRQALLDTPNDYYAMLARQKLGRAPLKGVVVKPDALHAAARSDEPATLARALFDLGLTEQAQQLGKSLGTSRSDIALLQTLDDANFGFRHGGALLPRPMSKGGALVHSSGWRASYAKPYPAAASAAATQAGIADSLLWAIARTESGFLKTAVSIAGARGLTQLLPSVARTACRLQNRPISDAQRAFEPDVALSLGATILALHQREFGALLLAAAAYNGAPENVALWMQRYGQLSPERFIERIPFKETRDYVKKVLATEAVYRALDGGELSVALPERIGPPPAAFTRTVADE